MAKHHVNPANDKADLNFPCPVLYDCLRILLIIVNIHANINYSQ